MTMKNTTTQDLWDAVKAVLTEKFIPIWAFFKKQQKISNKQPNPPPKRIRKEQTKPQVIRRKEIINIREEINSNQKQ